jgi:molecular chaperone DnaK
LDQVILVGGQTRMPLVRRMVAEFFECSDFESNTGTIRIGEDPHRPAGPQLNTSQDPDEAVALGAGLQAAILAGELRNLLLLDITPLSLGIETFGGLMNVIIPRNTTIPVKSGEVFTTAVDHQREMLIHVLQGERERARDNWSLGKFTIEFERAPKAVPRVGVQFEIDANGILHVLARDLRTGREKIVQIQSAVDVNDAQVQRMVEESVEHAFEDLNARRWIEARLQAEQTVEATRQALDQFVSDLEPAYAAEVRAAVQGVEEVLAHRLAPNEVGDLRGLKAAVTQLDILTQRLADLLMEKAVEASLRRQGLVQ